ncbi:hypothetical protein [Holdemania massiliensis]|uniref:Lipoprotein n=1 Tax=Holdemania massiliensis TaxID=1468449 RepID=A0A6N7S328_9FIRM|nr:hypothetical protein [Holdemania massiliensis]MSA70310.1 hypothetical protein [Holdemania massiliensis]MSA88159.1 hypothetical protein [Holdemania massiliensis]MSB76988.1 hypothetical protein [Holdemania massiliensis]MSC31914.1 hypothetical protein [Holdemania massiliensis]MSC38234.1 hypothetical protein [Holdemania massiliensis]
MNFIKKGIAGGLCLTLLVACSLKSAPADLKEFNPPEADPCLYTDAYAKLDPKSIQIQKRWIELLPEALTAEALTAQSTDIVLASVCSITGGSNFNEATQSYVSPFTLGKLKIIRSLKGSLEEHQIIGYARPGGIVSAADWLLASPASSHVKTNPSEPAYIHEKIAEDIEVEVGKVYLLYLSCSVETALDPDAYTILGYQEGMREIHSLDQSEITAETPLSHIEVYSNVDQRWEPLDSCFLD